MKGRSRGDQKGREDGVRERGGERREVWVRSGRKAGKERG